MIENFAMGDKKLTGLVQNLVHQEVLSVLGLSLFDLLPLNPLILFVRNLQLSLFLVLISQLSL